MKSKYKLKIANNWWTSGRVWRSWSGDKQQTAKRVEQEKSCGESDFFCVLLSDLYPLILSQLLIFQMFSPVKLCLLQGMCSFYDKSVFSNPWSIACSKQAIFLILMQPFLNLVHLFQTLHWAKLMKFKPWWKAGFGCPPWMPNGPIFPLNPSRKMLQLESLNPGEMR